jgi:hypothetical protein
MTYWATDKAGNRCVDSTVWFFVDIDAPATGISYEGSGYTSGDKVFVIPGASVILTASDEGSGVNYIEYSLDKRSYTHYSSPLKFTTGTHSLVFRAVDKVGNTEAEQSVTIMVDAITPTTRTDGDFSAVSKEDIVVGLVATDAESGVAGTYFRVLREKEKTGDFQPGASVTVEASLGDGNYTVQYYSIDRVGNTEKTKELKVRIDTQVAFALGFEGNPAVSSSKYLIVGKTEPSARIAIGIETVQVAADGSFSQEVGLKPGINKFVLEITDQAGNVKDQTVTITYNPPLASADWFLPLLVVVIIAGVVGGGAWFYMRGKKGERPTARASPARRPPPRTPPRPPVPPARAAQGRMPQSRSPQARILPPRAPPPVPPPTP